MSALDPVILALDTHDRAQALQWVDQFAEVRRVKVGLELFAAHGFALVDELVAADRWVFLDLKLHDIPRTVGRAMAELSRRGVGLTTVHALGGARMIAEAVAARDGQDAATEIVAVTTLTSHDEPEWRGLGFATSIADSAAQLAQAAVGAGADGVVCSPLEAAALRQRLGTEAILVTPGIRLPGQAAGDQRRIATPADALRDGATYLVMGRALTGADNPDAVLERLQQELATARS